MKKFQRFQDDEEESELQQSRNYPQLDEDFASDRQQEQAGSQMNLDQQMNNNGKSWQMQQNQNAQKNQKQKNQSLGFQSSENDDSDRDGSDSGVTPKDGDNQNNLRTIDPTVSNAVIITLQKAQEPLRYLLAFQISTLLLKMSRIILVLGLLFKLFFEMTCQKSSIHSLLVGAFLRDVISGILDLQIIFKIYEIRYKVNKKYYDDSMKSLAKEIMRSKRETQISQQQIFGRSTQQEANNANQKCSKYDIFELETAIGNMMPYIAYFMKILNVVFILRYDDEQFCHVFEKYTIIYLFLPIYFLFLVIFLCLTVFGGFLSFILVLFLAFVGKYIYGKYKQQKELQINEIRAKNLGFVTYSQIQNQLENNQCSICLNNYKFDDKITILKCSQQHNFHHACIQKWILLKGQCPSCRSDRII